MWDNGFIYSNITKVYGYNIGGGKHRKNKHYVIYRYEFLEHYYQVPTYTIGDLIDKLPKAIEGNCLVINYIYSEIIYKDILHYDFEGVGLLTTLYAVLCWVAENHIELIK